MTPTNLLYNVVIPATLGRSSEAVVRGPLEEAEERVVEPDLVG